jgi:hypothetical protein
VGHPDDCAAAVVAALCLLASSASAGTVSNADPKGDGHGPGDIRGLRVTEQLSPSAAIYVRIRTEKPLNIMNAAAWRTEASQTFLQVNIDVFQPTAGQEYWIRIVPGPSGPVATFHGGIFRPRGDCEVALSQPQQVFIRVSVPSNCLSGADYVRAFARYRLDRGGDGTVDSDDRAPNAGFGPKLQLVD